MRLRIASFEYPEVGVIEVAEVVVEYEVTDQKVWFRLIWPEGVQREYDWFFVRIPIRWESAKLRFDPKRPIASANPGLLWDTRVAGMLLLRPLKWATESSPPSKEKEKRERSKKMELRSADEWYNRAKQLLERLKAESNSSRIAELAYQLHEAIDGYLDAVEREMSGSARLMPRLDNDALFPTEAGLF